MICFVCLEYAATGSNLNKGGHCMEITRNEESRIISVWLTNADQQNEEIQNWLKGKYPVWKKEGYLTVVYKSGHEDLYENTLALLKHNRRLSARKKVEAEIRPGSWPKQKGWPGSSRWRKCQPRQYPPIRGKRRRSSEPGAAPSFARHAYRSASV